MHIGLALDSPTEIDHPPGPADGVSIILFDGVCNFCSGTVRFILTRDKKRRFRFAPLQSHKATELLKQLGLQTDHPDTIILVDGVRRHTKSSAALRIARRLSGPWPLLSILLVVPKPLRDNVYDAFAARRYRWFGKRESCFVPTDDIRRRFLE